MARTIPAGWTQSPGCLSYGDLWGWRVTNGNYADMLGGPSATSSCYPPDYQPTTAIIYATDTCPDAFTPACSTQTNGNWWSICCPTAYQFACGESKSLNTGTMFCRSPYPNTEWVTSSFTVFGTYLESIETYTATIATNNQGTPTKTVVTASGPIVASDIRGPGALWAMAVLITSTSSTSQYATTAATTGSTGGTAGAATDDTAQVPGGPSTDPAATPTTGLPSTGLPTSAGVGIGVGASAAALLVVLGGWLLYRRGVARGRRESGTRLQEKQNESDKQPAGHGSLTDAATEADWSTQYHDRQQQPCHGYDHGAHHRPQELEPTPPALKELEPTPPRPSELE